MHHMHFFYTSGVDLTSLWFWWSPAFKHTQLFSIFFFILLQVLEGQEGGGLSEREGLNVYGGQMGFPPSILSHSLPRHRSVCLYMYLSLSQQMDPGEYWDATNLLLYMLHSRDTHTRTQTHKKKISTFSAD